MRTFIISIFFCLASNVIRSQTISINTPIQPDAKEIEKQVYYEKLSQTGKTLKLNVSSKSTQFVQTLKDNLEKYDGKITSVVWDVSSNFLYITHNGYLRSEDLFEILESYNVSKSLILDYK